ncbi:hypothetical protein Ac2012v2_005799 [Leucoagaricus gongylophorus]
MPLQFAPRSKKKKRSMQVINSHSSLLSNYEVLALLQELEHTHLERSKAAVRIKKEEQAAGAPTTHTNPIPDISQNIRTIQVETIQYLTSDYLPTTSQTPSGISQLVKDISPYDLTKAEKLQIVNLAPTTAVELYVIVEELEDRLGESLDPILSKVKLSLSTATSTQANVSINGTSRKDKEPLFLEDTTGEWDDIDADAIIDDLEFVDQGEGAGIEGTIFFTDLFADKSTAGMLISVSYFSVLFQCVSVFPSY